MKYLYVGLILLVWSCQPTPEQPLNSIVNGNPPVNGLQPTARPTTLTDGLYFGISNDSLGRRGWLIEIKGDKRTLYMPPGNLGLRNFTIGPDGRVSFETDKALGDRVYTFDGRIAEEGLMGEFASSAGDSIDRTKVNLRKVVDLPAIEGQPTGLFSSVVYVPESGDLVGAEVIIIRDEGKLVGIFSSYENEMIPYATSVVPTRNGVELGLLTRNGKQKLNGTLSENQILLKFVGPAADQDLQPMRLVKRKTLRNIFEN